ncbi:methyltransferase type 12 [Methyloprofundus sedimenti]|uniref:Methyltransferase type 12 n=1 Tax=Methyloprofundus sedimenti TaxID=1420851 RepID=A0A1V8M1W8_9GAMM|nr:class I SAM-dependent methyltransferase [Methyloprofundus sedimenti]OQK15557.1 methyltransferase type 12 [Methyloprofundus sedimenti]
MPSYTDKNIVNSWLQNAKPWITAIRDNEIESRSLITNKAIIDTILQTSPKSVLDIGCGEGWLARELRKSGINILGIDIVPDLIEAAKKEGGGRFELVSYEDLAQGVIKEKFDTIVCNFSLFGDITVTNIFQYIPRMLNDNGYFIIQTIHPIEKCGDAKYEDGWRKGSWAGFSNEFSNPAPWYFRTLETWKALFHHSGLDLSDLIEPINPQTKTPASIIFIAKLAVNKSSNLTDANNALSS